MVATLAMYVTESPVFREGGKKRPQSEDLPQVAKQGFRDLELGFYAMDVPNNGYHLQFSYSTRFPEVTTKKVEIPFYFMLLTGGGMTAAGFWKPMT